MSSLTTEFEAANRLRYNQFFLEIFLHWFLLTDSIEKAERHHKRYLKAKKRARQEELAREYKSRKIQAFPRPGF